MWKRYRFKCPYDWLGRQHPLDLESFAEYINDSPTLVCLPQWGDVDLKCPFYRFNMYKCWDLYYEWRSKNVEV